jgi:hypothetical protein
MGRIVPVDVLAGRVTPFPTVCQQQAPAREGKRETAPPEQPHNN